MRKREEEAERRGKGKWKKILKVLQKNLSIILHEICRNLNSAQIIRDYSISKTQHSFSMKALIYILAKYFSGRKVAKLKK